MAKYSLSFVSSEDDDYGYENELVFDVVRQSVTGESKGQVILHWPQDASISGDLNLSDLPDILKGLYNAHQSASDHARLSSAFEDFNALEEDNRFLTIEFET